MQVWYLLLNVSLTLFESFRIQISTNRIRWWLEKSLSGSHQNVMLPIEIETSLALSSNQERKKKHKIKTIPIWLGKKGFLQDILSHQSPVDFVTWLQIKTQKLQVCNKSWSPFYITFLSNKSFACQCLNGTCKREVKGVIVISGNS